MVFYRYASTSTKPTAYVDKAHWKREPKWDNGYIETMCGWDLPDKAIGVPPETVPVEKRCRASACNYYWERYDRCG